MTARRIRGAVLALALLAAASARAESEETGAEFLTSVIGRIGGKDPSAASSPEDLARPVADLKAALVRVSESMAAAGVDLGVTAPAASNDAEILVLPGGNPALAGPPYVLAPTPESPAAGGAALQGPVAAASAPVRGSLLSPPPLRAPPLSKAELSAVYQAVADKGVQLDLGAVKNGYIPAAPGQPVAGVQSLVGPAPTAPDQAGYYYYFFPIRDLGDGKTGPQQLQQLQQLPQQAESGPSGPGPSAEAAFGADKEAALSVMAQLTGDPSGMLQAADGQKSVEPLFMAMSGFIGMALMFVLSVLFVPKWGALRSRGVTALKHAPDELASLTKLVVQSIEGKDCSERIACEVGRAVRTMRLGNKPLRILEIVLPAHLSKQISHIRRAVRKAEKCSFIPCKYPAWYSASVKPPLATVIKNKLPPKLLPSSTSPRPAAARSTPRSKPLPHMKVIMAKPTAVAVINNKRKAPVKNNNKKDARPAGA